MTAFTITLHDANDASQPEDEATERVHGVAVSQLRSFVERIERINEEIAFHNHDKKDTFAEAKAHGFDVAALKHVIKLRKTDLAERLEFEAVVDTYLMALGMKARDDE